MKGIILVTDTLFIFKEHEDKLRAAGYEIERIPKADASEAELIEAVRGKVGYILGGIEKVTDNVIRAADQLKAIVFTGADARAFIPAYELATQNGIAIGTTPGANAYSVAEYTLTLMLAMNRNIFELGRTGTKKFQTMHAMNELTVGIIGMGNIGTQVTKMLSGLGPKRLIYNSRTRRPEMEKSTGVEFVDIETLLSQSDIVSLHVSKEVGDKFISTKELAKMKDGALLVNCGFTGCVDTDALYPELASGRLRSVQDDPMKEERYNSLPLSVWFNSNQHAAYNTVAANKKASDMATETILNLLETGKDQHRVN